MLGTVLTSVISFISTNIDNIFVMMLLYARVDENLKKRHIVIGQYLGIGILISISLLGVFGLNFVPQKYVGLLGIIPIALGIKAWIEHIKEKQVIISQNDENDMELNADIEIQTSIENEHIKDTQVTISQNDENHTVLNTNTEIQASTENEHKKRSKLRNILRGVMAITSKVINPQVLSVTLVAIANGADNIGVYIPLFTGYSIEQLIVTIVIFILMMALWCFFGDRITSFPHIKSTLQQYKYIAVPVLFIGLGIYIFLKSGLIAV